MMNRAVLALLVAFIALIFLASATEARRVAKCNAARKVRVRFIRGRLVTRGLGKAKRIQLRKKGAKKTAKRLFRKAVHTLLAKRKVQKRRQPRRARKLVNRLVR